METKNVQGIVLGDQKDDASDWKNRTWRALRIDEKQIVISLRRTAGLLESKYQILTKGGVFTFRYDWKKYF